MSYLLDTNICTYAPSGGARPSLLSILRRLWVPTVVLAELYAGAFLLDDPTKILAGINDLLQDLGVLPFDEACAEQFGRLRGELKRRGVGTGPIDLQIAAVALVHDLTLVTNNTADFQNIPGLRLEDWLTP